MPCELIVRPLDAAAFAPFGDLLAAPAAGGRAINAGSGERFGLPAPRLQAQGGAACLAIFRTAGPAHTPPWRLHALERHRLGSQTFVPLGGGACLAVVAPTTFDGRPDTTRLQAFLVGPGQGVTLHPGTWHHPLLTLGPAEVLVLERAADAVDCELVALDPPRTLAMPAG